MIQVNDIVVYKRNPKRTFKVIYIEPDYITTQRTHSIEGYIITERHLNKALIIKEKGPKSSNTLKRSDLDLLYQVAYIEGQRSEYHPTMEAVTTRVNNFLKTLN